ncbi:hypothetical protein O6H91_01G100100 [Diphasiastrum complanatum]|uniref:Uncharacterized protein n=1 Tax=Diphasiastrum complanatum TaxID=34168 RepID=A0ACC2ETY5_DIPCM|nr:hypothetical protein O6H91_01G100100 [Diphasiastrum complanatum]
MLLQLMAQASLQTTLPSRLTVQEVFQRRPLCSPAISKNAEALFRRAPRTAYSIGLSSCSKFRSLNALQFCVGDRSAALGYNRFGLPGLLSVAAAYNTEAPSASAVSDDPVERNKLAQAVQVSKRLEQTGRYFKRLGQFGFWGQLTCTIVSAVILAFSVAITGTATSPTTFYLTAAGIVAAFISVFWSFGYIRLANRLRGSVENPIKAPPRVQVVKNLKNGVVINLLGMAATILGMQATVGALVARALTSSATPFLQGSSSYNPVLALDVFLVQASANTLLSHFLGIVVSLELLRSVTLTQQPPSDNVVSKPA